MSADRDAETAVLAICRKRRSWAMRQAPSNPLPGKAWRTRFRVVDVARWGQDPVAEGDTWADVLAALQRRAPR